MLEARWFIHQQKARYYRPPPPAEDMVRRDLYLMFGFMYGCMDLWMCVCVYVYMDGWMYVCVLSGSEMSLV